jgi:DNA invertase Pin-like site-specific DNA recombinase
MKTQKRAWLYSRIDAPEDTHGALKAQERELSDYAEQAELMVVGCSSDLGSEPLFERPGIQKVTTTAERGEFDVLLVRNITRLSLVASEAAEYLQILRKYGVQAVSPLQGNITEDFLGEG